MVEVGSLELTAGLNTAELDRGVERAKQGLRSIGDSADSTDSDITRMNLNLGSLGKTLALTAVAGATAFTALATRSPAVAGEMARMEVGMMELGFTAGQVLRPAFIAVADGLESFNGWLEQNEGLVYSVAEAVGGSLTLAVESLGAAWSVLESIGIPSALKWLLDNFGAEVATGLIVGRFAGPVAGAGAAIGANVIGDVAGGEEAMLGEALGAALGIIGASIGGPLGFAAGAGLGYAGGEGIEWILEQLLGSRDRKSVVMNQSDGGWS